MAVPFVGAAAAGFLGFAAVCRADLVIYLVDFEDFAGLAAALGFGSAAVDFAAAVLFVFAVLRAIFLAPFGDFALCLDPLAGGEDFLYRLRRLL